MNMISFDGKTLQLNSGILEENFGKMSFASIITEKGVLVKGTKSGDSYSFDYSGWTFQDVQSFDTDTGRTVFFLGDSPFEKEGKTLADLLETKEAFDCGLAIIKIFTDCCQKSFNLPLNGAGGILLELTNETDFTALFLPETLWAGAVAGKTDEVKAREVNWWINPTLHGDNALRFARSNLAYRLLTGRLPFGAVDTIERNADILDKKFLPVELFIEDLDPVLAQKIDSELELNSSKVVIPGKKERKSLTAKINEDRPRNESDAQKAARLQAEYHKAVSAFPLELLEAAETKCVVVSDSELGTKAEEYMARKTASVNTKRKIRRNASTIITFSVIGFIIFFISFQTIKTKKLDKTSKGLTAEETVEAFYQSINYLDTVFISDHSKGKKANAYANIVSQMYVIGKNRQAYSRDYGIQNPAAFFLTLLKEDNIQEAGLYGITNLKINGRPENMDVIIPVLKDKPVPVTEDKGIKVYNKMNSVQKVEFNMIHTEGEIVVCDKQVDTVTLTFLKDKWIVTDITSEVESQHVESIKFFTEYFTVLEMTGGDPVAAIRILKNQYPWLPSQEAFDLELTRQAAEKAAFNKTFGIN
ncbi:MAG: hypothetical protein MJ181_02320 [Treponema sp.]|nr:hypothetical protein [Treponema sp.]